LVPLFVSFPFDDDTNTPHESSTGGLLFEGVQPAGIVVVVVPVLVLSR